MKFVSLVEDVLLSQKVTVIMWFLSQRLCVLVTPDTLEEILARLGSFHRRLLSGSSSPPQRTEASATVSYSSF